MPEVMTKAPGKHRITACSTRAGVGRLGLGCMHPTQAAAGAGWGIQMGCMPAAGSAPAAQGLICISWPSCVAQGRAQGAECACHHPGGCWRWLGPPDGVHAAIRHGCSWHLSAHPHIPSPPEDVPTNTSWRLCCWRVWDQCALYFTHLGEHILRTSNSATPHFHIPGSPAEVRSPLCTCRLGCLAERGCRLHLAPVQLVNHGPE